MAEVTLTDSVTGKPLLSFSRMYGFRNIQSLVLKMKRKRLATTDYVELMACPSGCANGGGQIKTNSSEHPMEVVQRVEKTNAYYHSPLLVNKLEDSPLVNYLYSSNLIIEKSEGRYDFRSISLFQTTYHAVPKLETVAPLAAKW